MDWTAAIEKNREALKGIVAALVAMAAGAGLVSHGCAMRRQRCRAISTARC